jgi:hypothetical protein
VAHYLAEVASELAGVKGEEINWLLNPNYGSGRF